VHVQRKRHFVDRAVQGSILLRLVAHWALFLVAAGVLLYFIELVAGDPRDAARNALARHRPTVLAVLVLAPIFLRDLCKLTNRFAGPMVRLRRAMRDLAEGRDVAPIKFRDGDFWKDLADEFNRVLQRVESANKTDVGEEDLLLAGTTTGANADGY
jgi:hypothetical protein